MRRVDLSLALIATGALGLLAVSCTAPRAGTEAGLRSVRPGVAFEMLGDNPDLVVLDLRPFAEYSGPSGHLARAISAPAGELDTLLPALGLSADDTILLYSGDGGALQNETTRRLMEKGLRYIVQIDGGLEAWVADGFTVVVEDAPLSPRRPPSALQSESPPRGL